ncbi:MAG: hypothetical protein JXQ23_03795, partial [Clostridia bacterium]|nr:hypothetical protein [Clostridia bacterium]
TFGRYSIPPEYGKEIPLSDAGLYLIGENEKQLIYKESDSASFAILKNTGNIDYILSFLYDNLFQNDDMKIAFQYGIKDYSYTLEDGILIVKKLDENGKLRFKPNMYVSYGIEDLKVSYTMNNNEEVAVLPVNHKDTINEVVKNAEADMFYCINEYIYDSISYEYYYELEEATNRFFDEYFVKNLSFESAIDTYKRVLENLDMAGYLQRLNEYIRD